MTILQILYALAVAQHRNFSRAAESMYVSQPALSQQVRQLEGELGYALFSRSTHDVSLTEAGREFCAKAQPLANAWERFQEQISGSRDGKKRVRIGMGSRVYSNRLFDPIVQFFDMHPDLEVTFVTEAGHDFLSGLRDGELDLALDRMPPRSLLTDPDSLSTEPLIWERQCIRVSKNDDQAALSEIRFEDLHGCTIITGLENSMEDRTLRYDCQNTGMVFNRIYRSDGIETNMNLLRSGKGVIIGPESFADYFGVTAVPLVPKRMSSLDFICLKKNAGRPEFTALKKYLQKLCQS